MIDDDELTEFPGGLVEPYGGKARYRRVTHRWRVGTELLVRPFIEMGKLKGPWAAEKGWLL